MGIHDDVTAGGSGLCERVEQDIADLQSLAKQNEQQAQGPVGQAAEAQTTQQAPTASSPGNNDDGYLTQDAAAKGALTATNPTSIAENKEYGGFIYEDKNGQFHYTKPKAGNATGVDLEIKHSGAPRKAPLVGAYHAHSDSSIKGPNNQIIRTSDPKRDDFNSDHFSPQDKAEIFDWVNRKAKFHRLFGHA